MKIWKSKNDTCCKRRVLLRINRRITVNMQLKGDFAKLEISDIDN